MSMSSDPMGTLLTLDLDEMPNFGAGSYTGGLSNFQMRKAYGDALFDSLFPDPSAALQVAIDQAKENLNKGTEIPAGKELQKIIDDALAEAGLDQQGNPIQPEDLSTNPLTVNPLLVQDAVNTGPFVEDDDPNQKAIDAFIDLISGKYKKDKNDITPIDVAGVGTILAGQGSDNQSGTPTSGTPQGQTGTPQGETNPPQGGTPQGGTPTSDTPAVDSPIGTPTVSTGSVLDQTGTGDVKVDDQPKGFLTGMTPQAQAIINEGNRYDITATMLGPLIAKQDVPIISPLQFELDNVKQSPLSTALLFSNGLMGSFV